MSDKTPYVAFSNDKLNKLPRVKTGDKIECTKCGQDHELIAGKTDGKPNELLLFYRCGNNSYLGALNGKLLAGVKACGSGEF